jgi:prevent-host-death family protein
MKVAPLYEVKNNLSEYVRETAAGPIVITKNGKPCAALVHLEEDQDMESFLLSHNPRFLHLLDEAHRKTQEKGGTPLSELVDAVTRKSRPRRKKQKSKSP